MKESRQREISPLEDIKSKIWTMFVILRDEHISSVDYHVVLLLLSAFKDGLISTDLLSEDQHLKERLIERFHNSNHELSNQYFHIFQSFEPILYNLSENGLHQIFHAISDINKQALSENFPAVFDDILYLISRSQGRYAGEFIQPIELTRFMCRLAKTEKDTKVFNPFAGLASFGAFLSLGQDYYGQELNKRNWSLGALRLMAYARQGNSRYVCDDSILHWPDPSEKFNLIIANPPIGMRLGHQYRDGDLNFDTVEHFLIEKGVHSLKQDGMLIALLSQGFLFRGLQERRLREFLVKEDLIDTIISLPSGLLLNTGIPIVIIVLSKTKKLEGKVKFIDAKKFVIPITPRENVLNDFELINFINTNKEEDDVIRIVTNWQIRDNDYNLNVARYFQKNIEGVKLGGILELIRGQKANLPKSGKLIRIRDLKEDKLDYTLDLSTIKETELKRPNIHLISESCLLLAVRWRTLKPTLFEFKGEPMFRRENVLSFKVNESIVDKAYLINELHSNYVQKQLEAYQLGASLLPTIRIDDLMEVVIKLPSLGEQRAKVQGIFELSDKIKLLQEERNALAQGVSNKLYESASSIKHSLGKPLLNVGSSLRNIEKALSRLNPDWQQFKLNERYDLTIKDSFDSIFRNLELVHSMLRNNEAVLDITNYEITEIDFLAFIKGYVNQIKAAEKVNVNTNLDIHPDIKIQLKNKILLKANAKLLEIALNAIVENAYMHAFTDDSKRYKLEFRISLYVAPSIKKQNDYAIGRFDTYIKVEVANNGKPFPENYTLDKLIRKNSFAGGTGNTGQGGFDLNEIIKYHNNGVSTLELITDDPTEFSTTYSFLIPFNR